MDLSETIKQKILLEGLDNSITDLLNVGPNKPLAYLPLSYLESYSQYISVGELAKYFKEKDLQVKIYPPPDKDTISGSFFVWDRITLAEMLEINKQVLVDSGWSIDPDEFVENVATKFVSFQDNPKLYALIAYAFADYDNSFLTGNELN